MQSLRLRSLIRKEFIQILRDPRTLYITFALPIIQLFLLGYAATNDVRDVPLAVLDQDHSAASRQLLDAYQSADYFEFIALAGSEAEIRELIDLGTAQTALIIPPDYAATLDAGRTAEVAFVLDGSDPTIAATSLSAATLIGQAHSTELAVERLERRGAVGTYQPALEVRTQVWYNPDMESAYFMIPALIGIILQMLATMLTSTAIVRERERGTIEQLIVTPIRPWELIVGKLFPYVLISLFDTLEILVIGTLWFNVPIRGSIGLLLALSGLFLISSLGIGLFISTVAKTQQEAVLLSFFTMLPTIFLSGFFFPLAAMPPVLRWISYTVPLRYFLIIVRSVVLKGVGLKVVLREAVLLTIFGSAIMTAAAVRFRKRLD